MVGAKERYVAEAAEYGRCTENSDYKKGNRAFDRMLAALAELRASADRGESTLVELLTDSNGWVRLNAATHLLPLRSELASAVLETLANGPQGYLEFDATMVLQERRAGRLSVS